MRSTGKSRAPLTVPRAAMLSLRYHLLRFFFQRPMALFPSTRKRRRKPTTTSISKSPEPVIPVTAAILKYYHQRHTLFSLFDFGVVMDEEGWFSVTPEAVAARQARRAAPAGNIVIDAFAGVGGNAIQFALAGFYVVAVEIDPARAGLARRNAQVYGVEDWIEFVVGDFLQLAPHLKGDVVFLSPPWGGPSYKTIENYTLDYLKPKDGYSVFHVALEITPNIILFLPSNVDLNQVEELSWLSSPPLNFETEENYVRGRMKGITAYFGATASGVEMTSNMQPP